MPVIECGFTDEDGETGANRLVRIGPTLLVDIGFDDRFDPDNPSRPDPGVRHVDALIDSGAAASCIDTALADQLRLPVIDQMEIAGVGGVSIVPVYLAQIHIEQINYTIYGPFAGVRLHEGGQSHRALLGRTFLQDFVMIYDGRNGGVRLEH